MIWYYCFIFSSPVLTAVLAFMHVLQHFIGSHLFTFTNSYEPPREAHFWKLKAPESYYFQASLLLNDRKDFFCCLFRVFLLLNKKNRTSIIFDDIGEYLWCRTINMPVKFVFFFILKEIIIVLDIKRWVE